jgi:hypothetical protein
VINIIMRIRDTEYYIFCAAAAMIHLGFDW